MFQSFVWAHSSVFRRCCALLCIILLCLYISVFHFQLMLVQGDSMAPTYHLEFRYAQEESDLQSWFEGNFAYWNAAAIAADYDQPTMENVINLFAQENLAGQE